MNTLKLHFAGALFLIASFSAFSQSKEWLTHDEDGYSIQYPANWELNTSGQMGTSIILFSELSSDKDKFRENVNLLVQDISKYNLDLDRYVKLSVDQIKTLITDSEILLNERIELNKEAFQKIIYTGKQGELNLKFEQYYTLIKGKAFVLTFTCEQTEFDTYQETGEKILDSFKIK